MISGIHMQKPLHARQTTVQVRSGGGGGEGGQGMFTCRPCDNAVLGTVPSWHAECNYDWHACIIIVDRE